jgi:membrane protein YdbS with pleckstrin-like domain
MTDFLEHDRPADERPGAGAAGPTAPDGAPPRFERLDPRVVPYWLLSGTFGITFLGAIGFAVLSAFRAQIGDAWGSSLTLAIVLFAGMLLWQLIAPPLAYRRWRYSIDDDLLVARYGIVFHEEKAIPVSRLQHVDLTRGPIERLFGLATLVVHTAGTEAASFRLPGLRAAVATELRDRILEARGDDVV